jgi:hypothetical protein
MDLAKGGEQGANHDGSVEIEPALYGVFAMDESGHASGLGTSSFVTSRTLLRARREVRARPWRHTNSRTDRRVWSYAVDRHNDAVTPGLCLFANSSLLDRTRGK